MMNQEAQIKVFGETIEEMREAAAHNLGDPVLLISYAQGILSDSQEMAARGHHEVARQFVNKAKYFLSEANQIIREGERKAG
jgi:hypothetical protein